MTGNRTAARPRQDRPDRAGRPLWLLLPGQRVVTVGATRGPDLAAALYFCREGDPAWRPIAELLTTREGEGGDGGDA